MPDQRAPASARRTAVAAAVALLAVVGATGCGTDEEDEARTRAAQLVAATRDAGLAPRLTADLAEWLYGADAEAVCEAFDGSLGSAARSLLRGNPGHGRPKAITTHSAEYVRVVVEVYCPARLDHVDAELDELDLLERTG